MVLFWLGELRNCATQKRCRALASDRTEKPEVINGRMNFTYPGMSKIIYRQKSDKATDMGKRIHVHTHTHTP